MTTPYTDRPRIRLEDPRRPHAGDFHAHHLERWHPIEPGQHVCLYVAFGLIDTAEGTALLAQRLRHAGAIQIAGRTKDACKTARTLLSDRWRDEDLGRLA